MPSSFAVATEFSPGLESLLTGLESTRGDLQGVLVSTTRVTNPELPRSLAQLRSTLAIGTAVARSLDGELTPTAAQLRQTLATTRGTVAAASGTAASLDRSVREVSPELRQALQEFAQVMQRTNALLDKFTYLLQPVLRSVEPPPSPSPSPPAPASPAPPRP